jgi:aminoglycoside phosphotransferase (APT) family kinase protein
MMRASGELGHDSDRVSRALPRLIDRPEMTRPGAELDAGKVAVFLKDSIPGLDGELEVLQFPAGNSNLTYQLRIGGREFVMRRPPFGRKPKSGHDMKREYTVLSALYGTFPYCPQPLAYTDDESILGAPFYVMERLNGIIVRRSFPNGLMRSADEERAVFESLVDVLVELHSLDHRALGLGNFGKPDGYVERQVLGWSERFRRARTPDVPDLEEVMAWLHDKMPAGGDRACIIHNDYRLDNVVLDPDDPLRIIGVLDWEMATIGDPLMDLGETLAYWIQDDDPPGLRAMRMQPTNAAGAPSRDEVVARYTEKTGCDLDHLDFYYCFGLFRIAVISQQIYYRYYKGQSHDLRFGMYGHTVEGMEEVCRGVIRRSAL